MVKASNKSTISAVMWRFSLVMKNVALYSYQLCLCFTHTLFSVAFVFWVKVWQRRLFFGIASFLFGWLELEPLLLKESACLLCLHFFCMEFTGADFLLSFHLWSSSLYINHLLFIKKIFLVACIVAYWDLVPWSGIVSGLLQWKHGVLTTWPQGIPLFMPIINVQLFSNFYFGQKYFMGRHKL